MKCNYICHGCVANSQTITVIISFSFIVFFRNLISKLHQSKWIVYVLSGLNRCIFVITWNSLPFCAHLHWIQYLVRWHGKIKHIVVCKRICVMCVYLCVWFLLFLLIKVWIWMLCKQNTIQSRFENMFNQHVHYNICNLFLHKDFYRQSYPCK